jgi:simple sugar transport system substrate-binding protein
MTDRAAFLRRAGIGAAGISLGQLGAPGAALAEGGGGDFPAHPRWRFVFVSHQTLDPLHVATQFGAQDAAALVECSVEWTGSPRGNVGETVKALRSAITGKAGGIAVSIIDPRAFSAQTDAARKAGIPLVAFDVDWASSSKRVAYVGENPYTSGARAGAEIARLAPRGAVAVFAPDRARPWIERRLDGITAALARAPRPPSATVVRVRGTPGEQEAKVESFVRARPRLRGLFAIDGPSTLAVGTVIERLGLQAKGMLGGGFDLLPVDLELVGEGHLDFAVDQQRYVQGFAAVLQLFLARISEGVVNPSDTETSVLLRKADVKRFLDTKSRFEGSSSRHDYPLRRV